MAQSPLHLEENFENFPGEQVHNSKKKRYVQGVLPVTLPILVAAFPALFYYANNVEIVTLSSLLRTLIFYCAISVLVYLILLMFKKRELVQAANTTAVFMTFFNIYGVVYTFLLKKDLFLIEDYLLLPLFLLIIVYFVRIISRFPSVAFWKTAIFIVGTLVLFNLLKIVPAEIGKSQKGHDKSVATLPANTPKTARSGPDIYYFLFDEFASFETMRSYWKYYGVNDFASFLSSHGFYVAEKSRGSSIDTLHLMSERLNYETIEPNKESLNSFYDHISKNRAMAFLKSQGYKTVVFSEFNFGYPAMPPIEADYSFIYGSEDVTGEGVETGLLFDDFGVLVAQSSMLRGLDLPNRNSLDPMFILHKDMIYFTQERVTNLSDIQSPKFVYVHLLIPHYPFMFNEDGSLNKQESFYNWNSYLSNYKFTINYAKKIVDNMMENADPQHPPIIILQSDHGPRNMVVESRGGIPLEDFPEDTITNILNAFYLPGCETSDLNQEVNPINTFPIIFNCYFSAGIPLK